MRKIIGVLVFLVAFGIICAAYYFQNPPTIGACPFCDPKIIQKQKFYEEDLSIALYSYKPLMEGHCLIIPRRHVEHYEELTADEMASMNRLIQKTHKAVSKALCTKSYLLLQKNGKDVGQSVPHVHIHYIPKPNHDGSILGLYMRFLFNPLKSPISPEAMQEKTEMIASFMQLEEHTKETAAGK